MNRIKEEEKAKEKAKQKKRRRKNLKKRETIERGKERWPRKWRTSSNCYEQQPERVTRYEWMWKLMG